MKRLFKVTVKVNKNDEVIDHVFYFFKNDLFLADSCCEKIKNRKEFKGGELLGASLIYTSIPRKKYDELLSNNQILGL